MLLIAVLFSYNVECDEVIHVVLANLMVYSTGKVSSSLDVPSSAHKTWKSFLPAWEVSNWEMSVCGCILEFVGL